MHFMSLFTNVIYVVYTTLVLAPICTEQVSFLKMVLHRGAQPNHSLSLETVPYI